jgi:hypothetical protein
MLRKNHEAPSPPQTPAKVNWTWEIVSAENPNTDVLQRFHSSIIERYFLPSEQEEVSLWETHCVDPDPEALCKWAVVIAIAPPALSYQSQLTLQEQEGEGEVQETKPSQPVIAGGAVLELYYSSQCALVPYIANDEAFRGKGLSSELLRRSIAYLYMVCETQRLPPFKALFFEVLQARDDDGDTTSGTDAKTRQIIWQKMGVEPIEGLDLIHPGRMNGGHRYHLCVYVGTNRDKTVPAAAVDGKAGIVAKEEIQVSVVLAFIKDLFTGILADEDSDSTAEYEAYEAKYASIADQTLRIGPEFWQ